MLEFCINHIALYKTPQKGQHTQQHFQSIGLLLDGLVYVERYAPNGQLLYKHQDSTPYLYLGIPGVKTNFELNHNRKNWVIQLNKLPLHYDEELNSLVWRDQQSFFCLPAYVVLDQFQVVHWRGKFEEMKTLSLHATPAKLFELKCMVLDLLRFFVSCNDQTNHRSPAYQLKELIDRDVGFEHNLNELSSQLPISRDYLRLLFEKTFHMTPQEYRHLYRMKHINELIERSSLSINEIANQTGFKYTSHLCKVYKAHFGITPKEMAKRIQQQQI